MTSAPGRTCSRRGRRPGRPRRCSAPARRAATTGRSTPPTAAPPGTPSSAPATRCGAPQPTAPGSTWPTGTAATPRSRCGAAARRPGRPARAAHGRPSARPPAISCGRPAIRPARMTPPRSASPAESSMRGRWPRPAPTCTRSTRRPAASSGPSPAAARSRRAPPSSAGRSTGARATASQVSAPRAGGYTPSALLRTAARGYACWDAAISVSPSIPMAALRMSTLRTLPLAVIGKSATIRT